MKAKRFQWYCPGYRVKSQKPIDCERRKLRGKMTIPDDPDYVDIIACDSCPGLQRIIE